MGTLFNLNDMEKGDLPEIPVEKPVAEKAGADNPPLETSDEKTTPEVVQLQPDVPIVEAHTKKKADESTAAPAKGQGETENGEEADDDEAADDDGDDEDEKAEKKNPKKKEKERDPYEWGKCPLEITIQILRQDGNPKGQLVRVGTHTHTNPAEPPKISTFRTEPLLNPLPAKFWEEVKEQVTAQIEAIVKEFPDRDASWKANKIHKQDPQPNVRQKSAPAASKPYKRSDKKDEKKKPPSIEDGALKLFSVPAAEERKG